MFTEPLERLLRDGMTAGSVREVDPTAAATVLFNMVGRHNWRPSARAAAD